MTPTQEALVELAGTCERADGLLAEEVAIKTIREAWRLLNPMPQVRVSRQANGEPWGGDGLGPYTEEYKAWEARRVQLEARLKAGASLDAALSLVPEGCHGQIQFGTRPGAWIARDGEDAPDFNLCATPALALTAAALRARAAQDQSS